MRVISKRALREFWEQHSDSEGPLRDWFKITSKAQWNNLADTRRDYPHADLVGACTVFNIAGNKYRLITAIIYSIKRVYVRNLLTHAEYNRNAWKKDCGA
jgi:mRNA interferase HigB